MQIKKLAILVIIGIVTLGIVVTGCSSKKDSEGSVITGSALSLEELPREVMQKIDENKDKETYAVYNFEDTTYLVATWGEKNTGGYSVEITEILEKENSLEVSLQFTEPGENDIVTQALTYPVAVNSITQSKKENIIFKNSEGKELGTAKIEELAPIEDIAVNLYYGTENGETKQESRLVPPNFRDLSPEEQADILLKEFKKGSQDIASDRFSDPSNLLDKVDAQDFKYNEADKTLAVTLSESFLEIPEEDRNKVAESIILTFTSIFEPVTFDLEVVGDSGENLEEYSKSFK